MRFIPGDIVQHPDLLLVGQILTSDIADEYYLVIDFTTGKTLFFYDTDNQLIHYQGSELKTPMIFLGDSQ